MPLGAALHRQSPVKMCYSGLVAAEWREFQRRTGARIAIRDVLDLFVFRAQDPRVKIPKASGQPKPSAVSSLAVQTVLR